ncbi:hypothetical protein ACL02O_26025 [Micromonospora sp. MS34]
MPDCPNLAPARHELHAALADLGLPLAVVTEVVGGLTRRRRSWSTAWT